MVAILLFVKHLFRKTFKVCYRHNFLIVVRLRLAWELEEALVLVNSLLLLLLRLVIC